jgi:YegS/Rv2252/BmrU family lipid kinase
MGSLVEICETQYPRHATELARAALLAGVDTVIAHGGDGTVNEAVNGLIGSRTALGIIPAGTANDLASQYDLPASLEQACSNFRQPRIELLDVIEVNGWHYVTGGGVGLPCEVARIANGLKGSNGLRSLLGRLLGSGIYVVSLLFALMNRKDDSNPATVQYGNTVLRGDFLWLMAENQPVIGRRFVMSPQAVNRDGLLDICLVENHKSSLEILSISHKVTKGTHVGLDSVTTAQSHELSLSFEKPVAFFGDGETIEPRREFRLKVIPRALRLITGRMQADAGVQENLPDSDNGKHERNLQ